MCPAPVLQPAGVNAGRMLGETATNGPSGGGQKNGWGPKLSLYVAAEWTRGHCAIEHALSVGVCGRRRGGVAETVAPTAPIDLPRAGAWAGTLGTLWWAMLAHSGHAGSS